MKPPHYGLEQSLKSQAKRRLVRRWKRQGSKDEFGWALPVLGLIGYPLVLLCFPVIWFSYLDECFPDTEIAKKVAFGTLTIFLFVRAASMKFGDKPSWAYLTQLPIDPVVIHRFVWRSTMWRAVFLIFQNIVLLTLFIIFFTGDSHWGWVVSLALLLSWVQLGIALVCRLIDFGDEWFASSFLCSFCISIVGIAWHFIRKNFETPIDEGLFAGIAAVFDFVGRALPTGWPFHASGALSDFNYQWLGLGLLILVGAVPWLWLQKVKIRSLTKIREFIDKEVLYFDDEYDFEEDEDLEYYRVDERVFVCEESGERREAWQDYQGEWIVGRKLHSASELREKASKKSLFEHRELASKGWIESLCLAMFTDSEKHTLDASLNQDYWRDGFTKNIHKGVGFTRRFNGVTKWMLGFIAAAIVWKIIGAKWDGVFYSIMFGAAGLTWIFYLLGERFATPGDFLPINHKELQSIARKIQLAHLPAVTILTIILGLVVEWFLFGGIVYNFVGAALAIVVFISLARSRLDSKANILSVAPNRYLKFILDMWAWISFSLAIVAIFIVCVMGRSYLWALPGLVLFGWGNRMAIDWLRTKL